ILRRRADPSTLKVKMWLFPGLSLLTIVGIVAVLVQMGLTPETRSQLWLSLLAWAIVLAFYLVTRWRGGSVDPASAVDESPDGASKRVLVLANQTVEATELREELKRIDAAGSAAYFVCVPANPVDTGQAEHKGAVYIWDATVQAAQSRLDYTLGSLRAAGLDADGALGDYRPMTALAEAVKDFSPDRIVIATLPVDTSAWLRFDVVERARATYEVPVTHVIAESMTATR
ncbi:MAG: amino acid permease, partial [Humibacillus sp.]